MRLPNKRACFIIFLVILSFAIACNRNASRRSTQSTAKHYQLKGKVVSIDKRAKMANIDGQAIPGFMDAMTMPYEVKPESELDKLAPGDAVTAEIVVQDDKSWLENIAVTGHGTAGK